LSIYNLTHLSDAALLRDLATLVEQDRLTAAALLAHIAEVDTRRLHLPRGYASMHAYCVEALHLSDDAAYKRIQAARAARRFPALFDAVADGRLHLSAVCLIAPHLAADNFDALVALATHRRKLEIERLLAERFVPAWLPTATAADPPAASTVASLAPGQVNGAACAAPGPAGAPSAMAGELAPGQVAVPAATPGALGPPATSPSPPALPTRTLRLALTPATEAKLRLAQALLAHAVPGGNPDEVFDRALDALIDELERRKYARTRRPRQQSEPAGKTAAASPPAHPPTSPPTSPPTIPAARRTVPAQVRREVAARDQARCAFIGSDGHRCSARGRLEFDHVVPLARNGGTTVEGMRLLCRAHNQYEAERLFGREFMQRKRAENAIYGANPASTSTPTSTASGTSGTSGTSLTRAGGGAVHLPRGK